MDAYMSKLIRTQHEEGTEFERTTLALLQYTARIPVFYLDTYHRRFIAQVEKYGVEPFLSFYIDYGQRLSRYYTRRGRAEFQEMVRVFDDFDVRAYDRVTFVRSRSRRLFFATSENVGVAVASVLFSELGVEMSKTTSDQIDDYLRLVALYASCARKEAIEEADSVLALERGLRLRSGRYDLCDVMLDALRDRLGGRDPSGLDGLDAALDDIARNGAMAGMTACVQSLTADDPGVDMVNRLEEYTACRLGEIGSSGEFGMDWFAYESWVDLDLDYVMDDRHWECSGGQCVQVGEFKAGLVDKAGNLIGTVHQHLAANNDHSFTATWTEEHDGEFVTRTQWEEGNRATGPTETGERTEVVGAASYEVVESKDASGKKTTTYKTTIYYNDRTSDTWITVVDENGNIISDTGPSPEDSFEPPADPCASLMFDDPQHMEREITKMDTQIIPAIDSPLQAVDDPCFSSQSRQTLEACVSVWLCLDGKVDRDCKCVVPAQAVPDTPYAAQCQHQMCEEGYHCDPASGTCVGTVDGETIHMPGIGGTPFPMPYARRQLSLVRAHMEADRLIEMADQIRSGAINSPAEFR